MTQHEHTGHHTGEKWTAEFWDERYLTKPKLWSGNPNAVIVTETSGLRPGRALDVGCGEGGDVLWLAARGWQVTGLDVSQVALDRAADHARDAGPEVAERCTWEQCDVLAWDPPQAAYDLVTLPFFHLPSAVRRPVYAGLAGAVAPGGTFLVIAHHPSDHEVSAHRPPDSDLFFTAEDLVEDLVLGDWDVVTAEARPRPGTDPDGVEVLWHDTVLRAVRRG